MILQSLARHRPKGSLPIGYANKRLGFVLRILDHPLGCEIVPLHVQVKDKEGKSMNCWEAPTVAVPNIARQNNPQPFLACDTAAFVLGLSKSADSPEKEEREKNIAREKRLAFNELLADWAQESGDSDASRYLQWYEGGSPGLDAAIEAIEERSRKRLPLDLVALQVGAGTLFHDKTSVQEAWSSRTQGSESKRKDICTSCGRYGPVVKKLPQAIQGSLVPGTSTSQVALISGNFTSAQRGTAGSGLKSAPICASCAGKVVQAFNDLASRLEHRWGSDQDQTATIWWTKSGEEFDFAALDSPDPARIRQLYSSILHVGPIGPNTQADQFYALTFSGNVARLVVRSWLDIPLKKAAENIRRWFDDTATASQKSPHPALSALAQSAGTMVHSQGRWKEQAPVGVFDALLRTALTGAPLPRGLVLHTVARAKAEVHYLGGKHATPDYPEKCPVCISQRRTESRLGLILLILNRTTETENPLSQYLDQKREDPAYLAGRLFALRERLQYLASGQVNSSVTDRFFERASSSPASVEHSLSTLEKQHLKKLARADKKGTAVNLDKEISELHARLGVMPARLNANDQALWIAGYYQQRQHNFSASGLPDAAQLIDNTSDDNEEKK